MAERSLPEILKANHAVFQRRANDPTYGTEDDRCKAQADAWMEAYKYHKLTGDFLE